MKKTIIYSTIFGDYDNAIEQPKMPRVKYVMYTDNPNLNAPGWEVIHVPWFSGLHPRLKAKWFKIVGFPTGCKSIYIDGNIRLNHADSVHKLLKWCKSGVAVYKHPEGRDCIFDEAEYCQDFPKYRECPIIEQAQHYADVGMPAHYGLWACGIIVRDDLSLTGVRLMFLRSGGRKI